MNMEENKELNKEENIAEETKETEASEASVGNEVTETAESEEKTELQELGELDALSEKMKAAEEERPEERKADDVSGTYTGTAQNLDNTYFNKIRYINDGTIPIDDSMEANRSQFQKKISKGKIIDFVSIGLILVAFVGVILSMFLNKGENAIAWLNYVVIGVCLGIVILSFILTTIFNKKTAKLTKEYLNDYEDMLNGYVISDLNIDNASLCVDAKVNDQDVIQAHYFHTISRIESRAVVEGKRNGKHFSLAEVAVVIPPVNIAKVSKKPEDLVNFDGSVFVPAPIQNTATGTEEISAADMTMVDLSLVNEATDNKQDKKREKDQKKANANKQTETATGLFGKIYSYDMSVDSEEAMIVCFTGSNDNTVLPDNLTGFKAVKVPGLRSNIVVYAINPKKIEKFFDEEGIRLTNEINTNQVVQYMFISINSYGSKVGMTLSDDIMQLPVKQISHLGSYESYKDATDKAFHLIDHVQEKAGK